MAAAAEHIHGEKWRVRELHEEDAVSGQCGDGRRIIAQSQGVVTVEDQPDGGMGGGLHQAPGMRPGPYLAAPGQCLVPHSE